MVRPAFSLLGISGDVASLSDAQLLECVERNSASLMGELKDFKAGARQQAADRAKTIIARLVIVLQATERIRAAISKPVPPPVHLAADSPVAFVAGFGVKRTKPSLNIGLVALGIGALVVVIAAAVGIAWNAVGRQSAVLPVQAVAQVAAPAIAPAPAANNAQSKQTSDNKAVPPLAAKQGGRSAGGGIGKAPPGVPPNGSDAKSSPKTENSASHPAAPPMGTTKPPSSLDPAPKAGEIDKQEFNRIRQSLRDAVKETAEGEKVDAILAFANDPEIMKSPAATKAVLAEALVQSLATKDIRRAQTTLRRIRDSRALFGEEEYRASVSRVKNLAAAGGNRDLAFGLLDELRERLALSAKDAFAEKAAILRAAAQDKALKKAASQDQRQALADEMLVFAREGADLGPDISEGLLNEARKTAGTISNRERRAAFEKEMVAAKTAVAEGERYQQAVEQLAKDPADAAARKVRADILIGRGKVKEALVDLASLEHPLKSLTQETDSLLKTGAEAGGKDCFACAPRWVKAASEAKIGKNIGMLQLARELTNLAILAKNNSLDPFAMQKAKQQEALLAEAALADIQKTAVAKNEPRVAEPKMAATPKPSRQGRKGGDKNFPESIAEKWVVKYSGGNIRNYRINEDGQVLFVETNQAGIISQRGDDLVLDFSDGKLERLKLSEGSLIVEHFDPASRYPDSPNQTATGVRE